MMTHFDLMSMTVFCVKLEHSITQNTSTGRQRSFLNVSCKLKQLSVWQLYTMFIRARRATVSKHQKTFEFLQKEKSTRVVLRLMCSCVKSEFLFRFEKNSRTIAKKFQMKATANEKLFEIWNFKFIAVPLQFIPLHIRARILAGGKIFAPWKSGHRLVKIIFHLFSPRAVRYCPAVDSWNTLSWVDEVREKYKTSSTCIGRKICFCNQTPRKTFQNGTLRKLCSRFSWSFMIFYYFVLNVERNHLETAISLTRAAISQLHAFMLPWCFF